MLAIVYFHESSMKYSIVNLTIEKKTSQIFKSTRLFHVSNAFFQLNVSIAQFFQELSFKCCFGVAL